MRIGAAQLELSRNNGELFLVPGYGCLSHADWLRRYCNTVLPNGGHFSYKGDDGLWWLRKSVPLRSRMEYIRFDVWTTQDRSSFLFLQRYPTSTRAARGAWCLKIHLASAFARGFQLIVDESRGAAVDSRRSLLGCSRYFLLDVFLDSGGWFCSLLTFSEFSGRRFSGRCVTWLLVYFFMGLVEDLFRVFSLA